MIWSDDYAVGIQEVDDQHKKLFDLVNRLEPLISKGIYHGPEIESMISFLKVYTVTHFKFEEMCMKVRNCALGKKNLESHCKLLDFVNRFDESYQKHGGSKKNVEVLYNVLSKWLVQHICKIDQGLKEE